MSINIPNKIDTYMLNQSYDIEASSLGIEILSTTGDLSNMITLVKDFKIVDNKYCEISFYLTSMPSNCYTNFKLPYPVTSSIRGWNIVEFYVSQYDSDNIEGTEDCLYSFRGNESMSYMTFTITSTKGSGGNAYLVHLKYLI